VACESCPCIMDCHVSTGNAMKPHGLIESELNALCKEIGAAALCVNPYDVRPTPLRARLEEAKQALRRYIDAEVRPYVAQR
jgi:hypothetical protein